MIRENVQKSQSEKGERDRAGMMCVCGSLSWQPGCLQMWVSTPSAVCGRNDSEQTTMSPIFGSTHTPNTHTQTQGQQSDTHSSGKKKSFALPANKYNRMRQILDNIHNIHIDCYSNSCAAANKVACGMWHVAVCTIQLLCWPAHKNGPKQLTNGYAFPRPHSTF